MYSPSQLVLRESCRSSSSALQPESTPESPTSEPHVYRIGLPSPSTFDGSKMIEGDAGVGGGGGEAGGQPGPGPAVQIPMALTRVEKEFAFILS